MKFGKTKFSYDENSKNELYLMFYRLPIDYLMFLVFQFDDEKMD